MEKDKKIIYYGNLIIFLSSMMYLFIINVKQTIQTNYLFIYKNKWQFKLKIDFAIIINIYSPLKLLDMELNNRNDLILHFPLR